MGFARDRFSWGDRARKLYLPVAVMAVVTQLVGIFALPADAMPTSRYEPFFEERWPLKHSFYLPSLPPPMAAGFNSLADRPHGNSLDFRWMGRRSDALVLTREDRLNLDGLLQNPRTTAELDARVTSANDLYREAERDIQRFYSESADDGLWTRNATAFNPDLSSGGADFFADTQRPLAQDRARAELEAFGRELLKPTQQIQLLVQGATEDLRRYILLQEPRSTQTVLIDGRSGQALFMVSDAVEPDLEPRHKQAAASDPLRQPVEPGQRPQQREWQPLHLAVWHLLTSDIFFILYGIIGLCWASWRYIISRYA